MNYPAGIYARRSKAMKKQKYKAQKVTLDGIQFDSKAEANYYCLLKRRYAENTDGSEAT